jgi:hypothetical protein
MALYQNAGAAAAATMKAAPGRVMSFRVTNVNAAVRYFCIVDKITAPVNADPILFWAVIPAGTATVPAIADVDRTHLGEQGIVCPTGVSWAISTSPTTLTLATAAEHLVSVQYQ